MTKFKAGQEIEFRFYKNKGNWRKGRILKIDLENSKKWKSIYAIEEFTKGSKLNWNNVIEMCSIKLKIELSSEFSTLLGQASFDDDYEEFESKFGIYRTGGDVNNIQLYAEI